MQADGLNHWYTNWYNTMSYILCQGVGPGRLDEEFGLEQQPGMGQIAQSIL